MYDYLLYGGRLRSEIPFPELPPCPPGPATWTLRLGAPSPAPVDEVVHEERHGPRCVVRLSRVAGGYRYEHSCTGTFDLSADGREIVWSPAPDHPVDVARLDITGRIIILSVSSERVFCLHGSAIAGARGAAAFLGNSGSGKSTLALALGRAGAEHLSDDTLPIELGTPPTIWPGDHTIRLRDDSAAQLASSHDRWRANDGKHVMTRRGAALPEGRRAPLEALYLLRPAPADAPLARRRVAAMRAVPATIAHVRTAPILSGAETAAMLDQVATLVERVPVYELAVPRDWERIDDVAREILSWHGGPVLAERVAS